MAAGLDRLVQRFTPRGADYDCVFNILLVLSGKRTEIEQEQIPEVFTPISGKWKMKCTFDLLAAVLRRFWVPHKLTLKS
jgi:phenol 2-monooxygenase